MTQPLHFPLVVATSDPAATLVSELQGLETPVNELLSTYENWMASQGSTPDVTVAGAGAALANALTQAQDVQTALASANAQIAQLQKQVANLQGQLAAQGGIKGSGEAPGTAIQEASSSNVKPTLIGMFIGVAVGVAADEGYRHWQKRR